ncbi:MAG: UvrD-helicase domain-containing protein [Tepidisphaeraceae bacterium]
MTQTVILSVLAKDLVSAAKARFFASTPWMTRAARYRRNAPSNQSEAGMDAGRILQDLTEPQLQAVTHTEGPLLVIAGAGSGKTRVITRRIAYLIANGIVPASVLAVTFTNKAAGEMKNRVSAMVDRPLRDFGKLDQPWPIICTFHSLGLRILKHYAGQLGLPANFTVYDSDDQEKLIKLAIKETELATDRYTPGTIHHAISSAKNKLLTAEQYGKLTSAYDPFRKLVAVVYKHYQKLLDKNHAMDFDDLLMNVAHAFRTHPDILHELQDRFQYILIDEYQDTNHAQYIIAHALAQKHRNICVVGDPDQSIYAWRGADIKNILDFERDYTDAKVVKLEQNYRSTQNILDIASKLILRNSQRKDKRLFTDQGPGEKAILLTCDDEHAEAYAVAEVLKEMHEKQNIGWSQMAIFYRINALSRVMEDALRRQKIPYRVARGVAFYQRKEIKDVLAYLRAVVNPDDEISLTRIINTPPRGISDSTVKLLQVWALDKGWSLWQTAQYAANVTSLQARAVKAIAAFVQAVNVWRDMAAHPEKTPPKGTLGRVAALVAEIVAASDMDDLLTKASDPESDTSPLRNVEELISSAAEYDTENPEGSLEEYLDRVSLVSDADMLQESGAINLMTFHAAKGLEFPVVVMIAMEQNILPHQRVQEHPEQLEEERRLCFVGITRAQRHLFFSTARTRVVRGVRERTIQSQFLAEMPRELITVRSADSGGFGQEAADDNYDASFACPFRPLQMVRHPMFGVGQIVEISRVGQNTRLVINFTRLGRKTIVAEYTKLVPA